MPTSLVRYRPPIDLPQRERSSCESCVAAQTLYMSGLMSRPSIAAVDRQVGRRPGQVANSLEVYYFLLRQGLRTRSICAYDREQLYKEGLSYVRRYYAARWTPEWDEYFTPAWFEAQKARYMRLRRAHARFRSFESGEVRHPTVDDITHLLQSGWLVSLTVGYEEDLEAHVALAYGMKGKLMRLYFPDASHTLRTWNTTTLTRLWQPGEGILATQPAA